MKDQSIFLALQQRSLGECLPNWRWFFLGLCQTSFQQGSRWLVLFILKAPVRIPIKRGQTRVAFFVLRSPMLIAGAKVLSGFRISTIGTAWGWWEGWLWTSDTMLVRCSSSLSVTLCGSTDCRGLRRRPCTTCD